MSEIHIQLVNPINIDEEGLKSRIRGQDVRDCFLILKEGNEVELGLLSRDEMETTVASAMIRKGHGAMDIDASRIGTEQRSYDLKGGENLNQISRVGKGDARDASSLGAYGIGDKQVSIGKKEVTGRWPSNLILQHSSSCRLEGTKEVGTGPKGGYHYEDSQYTVKGFVPTCRPSASSNRGTEEVDNWICEPSCPVKILDSQSGILKSGDVASHHMRNNSTQPSKGGYQGGFGDIPLTGYGDEGGASRFFKQVKSDKELDEYLNKLVRRKTK